MLQMAPSVTSFSHFYSMAVYILKEFAGFYIQRVCVCIVDLQHFTFDIYMLIYVYPFSTYYVYLVDLLIFKDVFGSLFF